MIISLPMQRSRGKRRCPTEAEAEFDQIVIRYRNGDMTEGELFEALRERGFDDPYIKAIAATAGANDE